MQTRVIVNGAFGRMGEEASKAIQHSEALDLVARSGIDDDLSALIREHRPHIVVDFTIASAAFENAQKIIDAGVHPVIGTTGFTTEALNILKARCDEKQLGALIVPNFSIGAVLLMRFAKQAAQYFQHAEIIELHHDKKEDAPSGTALKTAESIAEGRKENVAPPPAKDTIPGSRGALYHNIPIHAVRLPGLLAHEEVIFGSPGETLRFRHDTINRECFMPGVLLACSKVQTLKGLMYGLDGLL